MNSASPLESSPAARVLPARVATWACLAVLWFVLWIVHVQLPIPPAPPELDPSWQQALSHALAQGIRFGRDLVFTFGPLGGPQHARYEPDLFWTQIFLYEGLFKGLLAWRWLCALRLWEGIFERVCFVLVSLFMPLAPDCYMLATSLVIATLLLRPGRRSTTELILDFGLLCGLGYVKFTYFALATVIAVLVVAKAAFTTRHEAWRHLAWFCVCAVGAWMACGQVPTDLPLFLWRSADLSRGYAESQAVNGPVEDLWWAAVSLTVLAALIGVHVHAHRPRLAAVVNALATVGAVFVAFRASFTYHQSVAVTFFGFMMVSPIALSVPRDAHAASRHAAGVLRIATWVVACLGYTRGFEGWVIPDTLERSVHLLEANLRDFANLPGRRVALETQKAALEAEHALPRLQAIVGDADVDFLGDYQAYVFLNRMRWNPRPVLQSYDATTVALAELDAEFLAGPKAPRFVLYRSAGVFGRLEGTDDAPALRELLHGYRPVAIERNVLLFERLPLAARAPRPEPRRIAELEIESARWVDLAGLPGAVHVARFDVRFSFLGKLRSFFLHAPITEIQVLGNDGESRVRRLVTGMARAGVLQRPMIEFPEDWIDHYTCGVDKRALRLRIGSRDGWDLWYAGGARLVIEGYDEPVPRLDPAERTKIVFGSFPTPPVSDAGSFKSRYLCSGTREYVVVGATSTLTFAPPPGAHVLVGNYGLVEGIVGLSDGVDFRVRVSSASGEEREVFARTLDKNVPDAARSGFHVPFEIRPGDRLEVSTSNPPGRNADYDLPYYEALEIRAR